MSNVDTCLQLFNAFDADRNGFVDFNEFAGGISVLLGGTLDERLRLAFNAYDLDASGSLSPEEVFHLTRSAMQARGYAASDAEIRQIVQSLFNDVDTDFSGTLDFNEFRQGILRNRIIIGSFWKSVM